MNHTELRSALDRVATTLYEAYEDGNPFRADYSGKPSMIVQSYDPFVAQRPGIFRNNFTRVDVEQAPIVGLAYVTRGESIAPHVILDLDKIMIAGKASALMINQICSISNLNYEFWWK